VLKAGSSGRCRVLHDFELSGARSWAISYQRRVARLASFASANASRRGASSRALVSSHISLPDPRRAFLFHTEPSG
jgi:hypothetical protein